MVIMTLSEWLITQRSTEIPVMSSLMGLMRLEQGLYHFLNFYMHMCVCVSLCLRNCMITWTLTPLRFVSPVDLQCVMCVVNPSVFTHMLMLHVGAAPHHNPESDEGKCILLYIHCVCVCVLITDSRQFISILMALGFHVSHAFILSQWGKAVGLCCW